MAAPDDDLLRPMRPGDLDAVLAVQRACYGAGFVEGADVVARRLAAAPGTAWVAQRQGRVRAYLSACPSQAGRPTALHGDFEPAGAAADTLYLHDLAVHPEAHGAGLGPRLVRHALAVAAQRGWPHAALVAVQGSVGFWQRFGFRVHALADPQAQARLAGYPGEAHYMLRRASPG